MKLEDRLFEIVKAHIKKKTYEMLGEASGISAASWKNVDYGKQRATSEMIHFVARQWPEYAFWMVYGESAPLGLKHEIMTTLRKKINLNDLSEAEIKELRSHIDERLRNNAM